jgi:uncharacterized lipoprotein YmbA
MIIKRIRLLWLALILVYTALVVTACGRSPTVKYYTLSPTPVNLPAASSDLNVAIGPADFPRSLARNQIVTRESDTQLTVDQYNIWSAPLEMDFLRVLGDNIAMELDTDHVAIYPAGAAFDIDYRVVLHVMQFDGALGENVNLRVRWTIMRDGDEVSVGTFNNTQAVEAGDDSYDALVAAHSAAIAALSQAITAELKRLGKPAA